MTKIIDKDTYKAQKLAQVHEYQQRISDAWNEYSTDFSELKKLLESFKDLHTYSARNIVLARKQFPGVTRLASFKAWRDRGVKVNKGAKAVKILAPCLRKETDEETGEDKEVLAFFKFVPVFDIAQTDKGGELGAAQAGFYSAPSRGAKTCEEYERVWGVLATVVERAGFEIVITQNMEELRGANGVTNYRKNIVYISDYESMAQRVAILAHELGHVFMHGSTQGSAKPRELKECEAEAFSFIVCDFLGIDTTYCAVPYLKSWAERKDSRTLAAGVETAWRVAQTVVKEIEEQNSAGGIVAPVVEGAEVREVASVPVTAGENMGESRADMFESVPQLTEKMRARYTKGLAQGLAGADLATFMTGCASGRRFEALVGVIEALGESARLAA